MKQFLKNAKAITILILMLSLTGCDNDDDNLPEVIAGFTHTINADTGTVTFINTSVNSKNYFWTFGDETSSTEINPVKTYPNGTYTIVLKASNVAGASNTFEDEITILIPEIATLPITFDGENTKYDAGVFGGASFEIVDNPDVSGTNDKASKVGAITNTGAEYEGINFDLGTQIDFTTNKTITMNFWADAEVDVLMKLEEGTGDDIEVTASHGGTGWEVISFDFNSSDKYSRLTLFVDGAGTTAGTFYIDDIMQIETPSAPCTPETAQSLAAADFNLTFETDPTASIIDDGAVMISVANPDPENDVNSSCQVGKVTRSPDFEYANNQIEFATKLDFNSNAGFKMKVWTPAVGTKVTVKLEGTGATEVLVTTTKANEWEELTFDFASSENGKYDKIVLFFNIETNTPGEFYIDDFMLYERAGGGTAPATAAPTPTQDAANVKSIFSDTYTDISGTNLDTNWQGDLVSETVTIEGNEAVKYSNVKFIGMELAADTDFSDMEFLHIDVWTPDATVLEITPISPPNENLVGLSGLSQGEWKSFDIPISDFTGVDFSKILQFKIDAQKGVIPAIVYMDNLYFYKTGGGTACTDTTLVLPIDFDCEGIDYASKIVGNVSFSVIDNPELSGINNVASKVGSIVNVGANWENAFFNLDTPIDFSANNTIKFKFYSTVSVDLKLKMEDGTADPVEVDVNHGGTGWEELSFTFTNTDSYNDMIIFVDGPGTTAGTFYVDDIEQVAGGGGNGGGDCPAPPAGELLPNGDFEAIGDCWELIQNGGTVTVSSTISNGGIKSGEISTAPLQNPALKQTRFAVGLIQPNTSYTVSFDIKASIALVDGAVLKAFAFSEGADGGGVGATQHILEGGLGSVSASWETKTYTFTTPAGADQVAGGLSFLVEVVCGGANTCAGTVNVDNVVVKVTP